MREELRLLKKENEELKTDLEQAIQAAYQLKATLGAPADADSANNRCVSRRGRVSRWHRCLNPEPLQGVSPEPGWSW